MGNNGSRNEQGVSRGGGTGGEATGVGASTAGEGHSLGEAEERPSGF